jgi:hypothetical protein
MKVGPVMVEAAPAVIGKSNVETVDTSDLAAVWGKLMELLKVENRPSLASIVEQGELVGVDDYQATIRYSADRQTFFNMMGRNGKKELVGEAISRVIGRAVGVKLELDAKAVVRAEPVIAAPAAQRRQVEVIEAPQQQIAGASRPTPEQISEAQKRPLVAALIKKFDASIVRINEE